MNIVQSEIISQPISGVYEEKTYSINHIGVSSIWTWIKFTDENHNKWVSSFRGEPLFCVQSDLKNEILILTSDILIRLDSKNSKILEYEDDHFYNDLTLSPKGEFIIAECYHIYRIKNNLSDKIDIIEPFQMDFIKFNHWENNTLYFNCDEIITYKNLDMKLDINNWSIKKI